MSLSGVSDVITIDRVLLSGSARAVPLVLDDMLSLWGGVDPATGRIIDIHHPQHGQSVAETLLFWPGARGSTAGPGALLELLYKGCAPAGIVQTGADISSLVAVIAASELGIAPIPIVEIAGPLPDSLLSGVGRWHLDSRLGTIVRELP